MSNPSIAVIPFEKVHFLDRICKDCKWAKPVQKIVSRSATLELDIEWERSVCTNSKQGKNMVTGVPRISSCSWHRNMSVHTPNCCTGKGLWWEPKADPS